MKLIILAAGYATRLYPLTINQPKPLLPVAGKPMIEHVLGKLSGIREIDHIYVVTNAKFAGHFEKWAKDFGASRAEPAITIINDGTTDDGNRLGAIGDLHLVLTSQQIDDDVIIVAGDNLFSDDLGEFAGVCRKKGAPVLGVYDVGELEEVKKFNAIDVDDDDRIVFFEEKPAQPKSTLTGIALYYYPRKSLPMIQQYIDEGNNPDQPGRLVQWMYPRTPFYVWRVPGTWFDIGSKETLAEANERFAEG